MLENIKSYYILQFIFSFVEEKIKLGTIIYNKKLQKKLDINFLNYKFLSGKYVIYGENNTAKEYNIFNNHLIFEGEYLNKKRNGKGKEYFYGFLTFEGLYLNGKRNGKGIEYEFGNIIFEGEYLNGKRWNGSLFSQKDDTIYIFEDACENFNDLKIKIDGKHLNLIRREGATSYYTINNKYEIKNGNGYLIEYHNNNNLEKEDPNDLYYNYVLSFEGNYLNGEKNGIGKEYDNEGKLIFEGEYLNGKRWNGNIYDEKKIYKLEKGKGKIKQYYSNGILKIEYEYLNGEKNGLRKEYSENGKLKNEIPYLNGKINGKRRSYYDKGILMFEDEYLYGYKINKYKSNFDKKNLIDDIQIVGKFFDGKIWNAIVRVFRRYEKYIELIFEGEYNQGRRWYGIGKEYDNNSKLIYEGAYQWGEKISKY